ncbi:MAG: nuclear transport factor 2 family protein [Moraxellaceae bacterium]|nr:nuclear transport factor 2 family protein [Moraxellaceae bacterium]MDZ4386431.1 nuclear transport factor 2 family protein [Moraxellaceae bacterium]
MSNAPQHLKPAVATSLAVWHDMIARSDLSGLANITRSDVVFRSPAMHKPYESAPVLALILNTVIQVFENFTYHRELATDDGLSVVLEFSAQVAGRELKGIDMIRFDEEGKIVEFEVMVRPLSGLQALAGEMGQRIGQALAGGAA